MKGNSFSVIIPLYNKEKSIRSTIDSVLNQSYPHFELIIVNDGSTDNSLEVAASFKDTRIRIINKPNGGVSSARNRGIHESKNDYIVFLDADDLWFSNCLEEFNYLIMRFSQARVFATNYNMSGMNIKGSQQRYLVEDYYYSAAVLMAKWNVPLMVTGCVALEKSCFETITPFNETITHGEDVDLWQRLADNFKIAKAEVTTMLYRTSAENRASKVAEGKQKKYVRKNKVKRDVKDRSEQLYLGCEYLMEFIQSVKKTPGHISYKDIYEYRTWIFRAALLYFRYRALPLINISQKGE